ncbi:hypothetical protein MMC11_006637 [Xylographa trunciseda]|nr:hypothetical protein [Xylographa trunciseda]
MADPVQFCRFRDHARPNTKIDFCVGVTMHQNTSTSSHDLMLTFTHTRQDASPLGWTAVGLGESMEGSLMFILYGDPLSSEPPILSIRGSTGHHQPTLVTQSDMNGADLRVVDSAWVQTSSLSLGATNPDYIARVSVICYSCHLWPGTHISAEEISQPWIWAWNPNQNFDVYMFDSHLEMHGHHTIPGSYGSFYVDMARSINVGAIPSLPPIRPGVSAVGASATRAGIIGLVWSKMIDPAMHFHGLLMGMVIFLVFPAGVISIRSESPKAFNYHWVLQILGSVFMVQGMIVGLFMRPKIDTVHQIVGIAIVSAISIQGILGWRHHVSFLREQHRTWLSHAHLWLGKFVLLAGFSNIATGMILYGWPILMIVMVSGAGFLEFFGLTLWVWRKKNLDRGVTVQPNWAEHESRYHPVTQQQMEEQTED